jgi:hypothetical protein
MNKSNFTTTLSVDQTPKKVFDAIKNISGWWSAGINGSTDKLNDEFIYHYKDIHYSKMKLIELVENQKVVWLVLDNYFKFTDDKSEWIGTKLVFDISQHENKCYEICMGAWTNFIHESLLSLILNDKGQPNPKENHSFDAKLAEKWKLEPNVG